MDIYIFLSVYCLLWNIANAWFNKKFIELEDFHKVQSLQITIMGVGVSLGMLFDPISILSAVLSLFLIISWRFFIFDFLLNKFRGLPLFYKLWGNIYLKLFVFIVANVLFIYYI